MRITEVRVKLMDDPDDRLQAFCSVTFDNSFAVRDLKIIEGTNGPFVAMPSRKLTAHCTHCSSKNHLRAAYCNQCGGRLRDDLALKDPEGRTKLYADIAHPINSECREMIQEHVIAEYQKELNLSKEPGYVSRYDEAYDYEPAPHSPPKGDSNASSGGNRKRGGGGGTTPNQRPKSNKSSRQSSRPKDTGFGEGIL